MKTKGQAAQVAQEAMELYSSQVRQLSREALTVQQERTTLQERETRLLLEAATALLPDAQPATLLRVEESFGPPGLPGQRESLEAGRAEYARRLAEIRADDTFRNRERLLEPRGGQLVLALRKARKRHEAAVAVARRLSPCATLLPGGRHLTAFQRFWRSVTFAEQREQRARDKVTQQLGYSRWDKLEKDYRAAIAEREASSAELDAVEARQQALQSLLEEHERCLPWVENFEARLLAELRDQVARYIREADARRLHRQAPESVRKVFAELHGIQHQIRYLGHLIVHLQREVDDRGEQRSKIEQTRRQWLRKPWEPLSGNKDRWLKTLPQAKAESTQKTLRWNRDMRRNLTEYEDWDSYSVYLEADDDFLPYDAFTWGSDAPTPWEGFARVVLPELDEYRREQQEEKADYSRFKEWEAAERASRSEHRAEISAAEPDGRADSDAEHHARDAATDAAEAAVFSLGAYAMAEAATAEGALGDVS